MPLPALCAGVPGGAEPRGPDHVGQRAQAPDMAAVRRQVPSMQGYGSGRFGRIRTRICQKTRIRVCSFDSLDLELQKCAL